MRCLYHFVIWASFGSSVPCCANQLGGGLPAEHWRRRFEETQKDCTLQDDIETLLRLQRKREREREGLLLMMTMMMMTIAIRYANLHRLVHLNHVQPSVPQCPTWFPMVHVVERSYVLICRSCLLYNTRQSPNNNCSKRTKRQWRVNEHLNK